MKVTAVLCDFAQVSPDGKLTMVGAGITRLNTAPMEPPLRFNASLAVLIEIPWDQTNRMHRARIELVFDGAEGGAEQVPIPGTAPQDNGAITAQFNAGRGPEMVLGESTLLPIAVPLFGLPLPAPGGYGFKVFVDDVELAHVPFQARVMGPMGFAAA